MKTRVAERGRTFADRVLPEGVARRIAQNTGWLLAERLARLLGAFAITIWVVRYLGPEDFGLLAYAISITMIAEVTSGLGVGAIVVRELVKTPEAEAELLGSAFALRLGGQAALDRQRRAEGVVGPYEGRAEGVADGLEDLAGVGLDGLAHQGVVALERSAHRVGVRVPTPCRALDVGEEEGDGAGGELAHGSDDAARKVR